MECNTSWSRPEPGSRARACSRPTPETTTSTQALTLQKGEEPVLCQTFNALKWNLTGHRQLTRLPPCSTDGLADLSGCPRQLRWPAPRWPGAGWMNASLAGWCTAESAQAVRGCRGTSSQRLRLARLQQSPSSTWCSHALLPGNQNRTASYPSCLVFQMDGFQTAAEIKC